MAYATQNDMTARFGSGELIELTDRAGVGVIDAAVLAGALDDASAEIDSYLAGRYAVPLAQAPRFLAGLCCDIARYRLCGSDTRLTEAINERYRNAIRFLEKVASGAVSIGPVTGGAVPAADNPVIFNSGGKAFARGRGAL
ncbi:gp436 family protein [Cupriavidus sp. BIC8F]|uniref:gp436 family protein n=1 Tax=Cupriavidus sp. BIC8F TaxID=3079014 RepID=UPI00291677D4|nr:phage protein Gp36 family protein [Cupriavidus sp. BIC8F]